MWEVLGKCQNYKFFYIFWNILNKMHMKDNFDQECEKGGSYPFRTKLEQLSLDFPGK